MVIPSAEKMVRKMFFGGNNGTVEHLEDLLKPKDK
jgi:hypothetical protein